MKNTGWDHSSNETWCAKVFIGHTYERRQSWDRLPKLSEF